MSPHTYSAFISYSRHDGRVAKWLQRHLETRPLPRRLRQRLAIKGRTLGPVFRDESDLPANAILTDGLRSALDASRCLVVVCSPYAVASEYVDSEIRYFKALGRGDRIFCVIAGGIPNASRDAPDRAALECFPAALRFEVTPAGEVTGRAVSAELLPLAADVRGADAVLPPQEGDRIIAGILGVPLRELEDATSRQTRMSHRLAAGAVAAALALALGVWDYAAREHVGYYRDWVRRYGAWEGVDPVTFGRGQSPRALLRFVRHGRRGRLTRVDVLNGSGGLTDAVGSILGNSLAEDCSSAKVARIVFEYDAAGRLIRETMLNQFGGPVEIMQYTGAAVAQFTEASLGCSRTPSGVQYVRFTRDRSGLDVKLEYLDAKGQPARNLDRVYGYEIAYDQEGHEASRAAIDQEGRHKLDRQGIWEVVTELAPDRRSRTVRLLGLDGAPAVDSTGAAGWRDDLNDVGDPVVRSFLGPAGERAAVKAGYAAVRWTYDRRGNTTRAEYLGLHGERVFSSEGYAGWKGGYDAFGYRTRYSRLGLAGEPVEAEGYAGTATEYDQRGSDTRTTYLGIDGRPTFSREGYAARAYTFDIGGRVVKVSYFGPDGRAVLDTLGIAGFRNEYDARGRKRRSVSFGLRGEAVTPKSPCADLRQQFDERGNVTRQACFGPRGAPTLDADGVHAVSYAHDEEGNMVRWSNLGLVGTAMFGKSQPAAMARQYDERGNVITERNLGLRGEPVLVDGVAEWRYTRDPRGNLLTIRSFGLKGEPVLNAQRYAAAVREFDRWRHVVKTSFYGPGGTPVATDGQAAGWAAEYDERGRQVAARSFGVDGKPAPDAQGVAATRDSLDARGRPVARSYLGADGEPVLSKDRTAGWHQAYDPRGNVVAVKYVGLRGETAAGSAGYAEARYEYDGLGRMVRQRYFGADGRPVLTAEDGVSEIRDQFDAVGNLVRRSYADVDGKPVVAKFGYAARVQRFDARGNEVERRHLGLSGEPAMATFTDERSFARREREYSPAGQLLVELLYDASGTPIEIAPGVQGYRYSYDANGAKSDSVAVRTSRARYVRGPTRRTPT